MNYTYLKNLKDTNFIAKCILSNNCDIQGIDFNNIDKLKALILRDLKLYDFKSDILKDFAYLSNIESLVLTSNYLEEDYFEFVKNLYNIRDVYISSCSIIQNLNFISNCIKLNSLSLISMSSLRNIEGLLYCLELENIYIDNCNELTSLKGLENCHKIRNLKIYNCFKLKDLSVLDSLPKIPNISILNNLF